MNLVIGSTGSIGSAVVDELSSQGRPVRALVRDSSKAKRLFRHPEKVELVQGSVENPEVLKTAFLGAKVVFNCVNLPYPEWSKLPALHKRILEAAKRAGAKMVFPGNVYIYGHAQSGRVNEAHPRNPCSRKGVLRVQLEDMFMASSRTNEVPTAIVRFPDFYGPNASGANSMTGNIFKAALDGKTAQWYGNLGALHEFIFIADAGKAMVMASERAEAYGQDFNVPGPEPISANEWIGLVFKEAGSEPRMKGTSKLTMQLFGMFNKIAREFAEMQYLTQEPLILDGTKFMKFFGTKYPSRSYPDGIRETLAWMKTQHG
ncbi:MAG: NAD-dependent epimerase/dehydratase family protein [Candidatus Bathyarchaeia archaeon]|jgi:nucleoside-diphosphate-sugar epimerase